MLLIHFYCHLNVGNMARDKDTSSQALISASSSKKRKIGASTSGSQVEPNYDATRFISWDIRSGKKLVKRTSL